MRILIVGSGRSGEIDIDADIIVCANSSISRIPKNKDYKIIHVASMNLLDPHIIKTQDHLAVRRRSLLNREPSELLLYPGRNISIHGCGLNEMSYKPKKIIYLNKYKLWILVFLTSRFETLKYSLKQKDNIFYNLIRLVKYIYTSNINPYFIPSTGLFALLYTINRFGKGAEYIVDGISCDKNGFYYMDKFVAPIESDEPQHTDFIILPYLKNKFNLTFIE